MLKEMREKADLATLHSEEENESEDDHAEKQEPSSDELDDDFFMNE